MKTKKTTSSKIEKLVNSMTESFQNSLMELVSKIGSNAGPGKRKYTKKSKVKAVEAEVKTTKAAAGSAVFMDVLKFIGRPATTKEIAGRLKMVHPEVKLSKTALMQQLYNSASYLSKEGVIERHPVGKRQFEYSLKKSA